MLFRVRNLYTGSNVNGAVEVFQPQSGYENPTARLETNVRHSIVLRTMDAMFFQFRPPAYVVAQNFPRTRVDLGFTVIGPKSAAVLDGTEDEEPGEEEAEQ